MKNFVKILAAYIAASAVCLMPEVAYSYLCYLRLTTASSWRAFFEQTRFTWQDGVIIAGIMVLEFWRIRYPRPDRNDIKSKGLKK
jgi:hypothetical protein